MVRIPVYTQEPVVVKDADYQGRRGQITRSRTVLSAAGANTVRVSGRNGYVFRIRRIIVNMVAADGGVRTVNMGRFTTFLGAVGTDDRIVDAQTTAAGGGEAFWFFSPDADTASTGALATTLRKSYWIDPWLRADEYLTITLTLVDGINDAGSIDVEYEEMELT